jgi:hypothetical protein
LENLENYLNSFSIASDSTHPEVYQKLIKKLVLDNYAVKRNLVHVHEYKGKDYVLPTISVEASLGEYVATPTVSNGSIELGKRAMSNKRSTLFYTWDPEDLLNFYPQFQPDMLLTEQEVPAPLLEAIFDLTLNKVGNQIGRIIWNGDSTITTGDTSLNRADGLIKLLKAEADVKKVSGAVALTKTNVVDAFEGVLDVTDQLASEDAGFKMIINKKTADLYRKYQQSQGFKGVEVTQKGVMDYSGVSIVIDPHVPNDTVIGTYTEAGEGSNFWMGTNLTSDLSTLKYGKLADYSNEWFTRMDCRLGFGIRNPEHATLYSL